MLSKSFQNSPTHQILIQVTSDPFHTIISGTALRYNIGKCYYVIIRDLIHVFCTFLAEERLNRALDEIKSVEKRNKASLLSLNRKKLRSSRKPLTKLRMVRIITKIRIPKANFSY